MELLLIIWTIPFVLLFAVAAAAGGAKHRKERRYHDDCGYERPEGCSDWDEPDDSCDPMNF